MIGLSALWLGASAGAAPAAGAATATFGKTTVGASSDYFVSERKRMNAYALPEAGSVTKLSVYLAPTSTSGQQVLEGVIYSDNAGKPQALLGVSEQLTFKSTNAAGWYDLSFVSPLRLAAGTYWIGVITGATPGVAGWRYDGVSGARAYNANTYASGPTNPFGAVTTDSQQASLYATYTTEASSVPVDSSPPTISGTAQQGQTLTEHNGIWTNSPTGFTYQWLQCDSLGNGCMPIAGAAGQTYVPTAADVGHRLAVQETASNKAGSGVPVNSAPTAAVVPPPPTNTSPPTIAGAAQQGQTLTEARGTWTNEPTSFGYQWLQCDGSGNSCKPIVGATSQTYVLAAGDVEHTIRVQETASNAGGSGTPATSSATAAVTPQGSTSTFGKTSVGALHDGGMLANYKIVHSATLSAPGSVTKLSLYAIPGINSPSPQVLRAVIYADSGGSPGALLAAGTYVTYRGNINGSGWLELPFGSPVALTPGTYWLGFITSATTNGMGYVYDRVANARAYNTNSYASGPSNPFGSATKDSEQASIYATYVPRSSPPENTSPPAISGTAQQGQTLTEAHGTWTNTPSSYAYQWQQCDGSGNNCAAISGATGQTYTAVAGDVGHTLRVQESASNAGGTSNPATSAATAGVTPPAPSNSSPPTISGTAQQGQTLTASPGTWTSSPSSYAYEWNSCDSAGANCAPISGAAATTYTLTETDVGKTVRVAVTASNAAGPSAPATSAQTAVVATGVSHLEYVLQDGITSVYDMDHEYKLVKTISLPSTKDEVRGASVAPSTHILYVPHGGDGGPNGNGSVLAYDLVQEKVLWDVKLNTGIDSGQVSPDASKLYVPSGELAESGIWNILSASNGELIGTIKGGSGAHNTVVSNDGRFVYLGGRLYNFLDVYETATGKVKEIGPLIGTVRPLTVNSSNTLAFTTATNFDGFQVSSITTGKVLFTVSFGEVPKGFRFTSPSHGISLSPDEKQVYVIDAVNKQIQFWDVSKVKEGLAPTQIGVVQVAGLDATPESPCAYDCGRGGWLQLSRDGRFLFVGDSGEVIETATRTVLTTLPTLAQTKKSIEVDWQGGVPVATSGRTGVGYVE